MSQLLINEYLKQLDILKKVSGSSRETIIREAFKDLLKAWGRQQNLVFLAEFPHKTLTKTNVTIDGALLHELRMPLGYWEAKDEKDDLDEEIEKKFKKGYPQDNIIFSDDKNVVLIQHKEEVLRASVEDTAKLAQLLKLFFGFERPEIASFRKAVEQFKTDLPAVLESLREMIDTEHTKNKAFRTAEAKFLAHAQEAINPSLTDDDVREMLIQHILTEEIFATIFKEGDFHRANNVAKELYALESEFFTGSLKTQTLKGLEPYYAAINSAAAQISSHGEKQTFLKVIYENFYKVYNVKAADRLGVVYTPNEIVRFMIEGADWLCETHFGKNLIDKDVEILDPATGTGTFICELLEHFRGQPAKLKHKYQNELHANEVAILPYYVANLNIEATYAAITEQYEEFPNLCFVDTLDNVGLHTAAVGTNADLFGSVSEENVARIKRQNSKRISVVIGNPPYNANQLNENDNNKNREYPAIDKRIKDTYQAASNAQKTKYRDPYVRFIRWASDRLPDNGILVLITNRSFVAKDSFDGVRAVLAREFDEIRVVDLGGAVKDNPKLSGTKHNVFGIQAGVAISFMIKRSRQTKSTKSARVFYARRPEMETAEEKLSWLATNAVRTIAFDEIRADAQYNWLNLTSNDFGSLVPLASKGAKTGQRGGNAIFKLFTLGLNSGRDDWMFDYAVEPLLEKSTFLVEFYESERKRIPLGMTDAQIDKWVRPQIKWTAELKSLLRRNALISMNRDKVVPSQYRPFCSQVYLFERLLTKRMFRIPECQPSGTESNKYIAIPASGATGRVAFCAFATRDFPDLNFFTPSPAHAVVQFVYDTEGRRHDNITDWGLKQFQAHYEHAVSPAKAGAQTESDIQESQGLGSRLRGNDKSSRKLKSSITKEAIFHYCYAVLHDPIYREKYALNLKREFPRIPFYGDTLAAFERWAAWGKALMDLHIGYEGVAPFALSRVDVPDAKARAAGLAPKAILRADPAAGKITIDSETTLSGVPAVAWEYKLGNRCALEWILDQYKEKKPKDPTIREKFDTYRFADYKEKVIDLLMRVTTVSVETTRITNEMKATSR
jgi:predicted helicase